jgi:hypothetical protein
VSIASFQRFRKPNSAITPVMSTISPSSQCVRGAAAIAGVTAFGTLAAAIAYSNVARSAAL